MYSLSKSVVTFLLQEMLSAALIFFKALFTNLSAVKDYYSAKIKRALVKETAEGNRKAFISYIKKNFNFFNLEPKKILFYCFF